MKWTDSATFTEGSDEQGLRIEISASPGVGGAAGIHESDGGKELLDNTPRRAVQFSVQGLLDCSGKYFPSLAH